MKINAQSYKDAIQVQDACNINGVVNSFSRHLKDMIEDGLDNPARNSHPITILFVDKIMSLVNMQSFSTEEMDKFHVAYEECKKKSEEV